jgi:hypothetical protein
MSRWLADIAEHHLADMQRCRSTVGSDAAD